MMGHREKFRGSYEYEAFSKWGKRYYDYLSRAGVRHLIKKKFSRRIRKLAKLELK